MVMIKTNNLLIVKTIIVIHIALVAAAKFNVLGIYGYDEEDDHESFALEAQPWLNEQGQRNGFEFHATNNLSDITKDNLNNYQVVMLLDSSTKNMSKEQQQAIEHFVMVSQGGLIGFHAANYNEDNLRYKWDWLHRQVLGTGPFKNNTWFPTNVTYHVDTADHPAMKGLPIRFESCVSEWYSWENDLTKNPDIEILASIDKSSFPVGTDPTQSWYSGYFPVIFANRKHRVMYCNFGHNLMDYKERKPLSSTFASSDQNRFLVQAIKWLAASDF